MRFFSAILSLLSYIFYRYSVQAVILYNVSKDRISFVPYLKIASPKDILLGENVLRGCNLLTIYSSSVFSFVCFYTFLNRSML